MTVLTPLDLGPKVPMAVFTSTEMWRHERIHALALYCSDGRWGEAFDEFCHRHLLLPRYDRFAVPGGPAWLVSRERNTAQVEVAREQLTLLVQVHELERIVLVTHYGCAVYAQLLKKEPEECLPTQMEDLRSAAEVLNSWFPSVRVDAFLAMRSGNSMSFHGTAGAP